MKYRIGIPGLLALVAVLPGCGKGASVAAIAQAVTDRPNCLSGQDHLWSALYRAVDREGALPEASAVEAEVRNLARTSEQADALGAAYATVAHEVRFLGREEAIVRLAEMEIGDRTTADKRARQDEVEKRLSEALAASVEALGECPVPPATAPGPADTIPLFESWRNTMPASLYGAYKAISVGYQSCNALGVAPLSGSTPPVEGVTVTGTHAGGVGLTREVADASALFRTNPYYADRLSPAKGCFTASTTPLIYDYGGKPYASTVAGGSIDFTRNAGSGTPALGVDCSGFVTTAVLAGGLRLKRNVSSKAAQSGGVNAAMYTDPAGNGLTCFNRLASTKTEDLRPGDVIANTGHVIMVDEAGGDPFGIAGAKTAADCDRVGASKFSFTIIQSSSSKGGIGMNRYRAADFLAGYPSMRVGLEAYARSFCRVRLGLDPTTTLASPATAVIVRNQGGPGCTDSRIPLVGESCLQSCGALAAAN
jgi:hypothetical protein